MIKFKVKLKNADGEVTYLTLEAMTKPEAHEEAEKYRGRGWMAIDSKVLA